jgi:thioredoxin reductase
MKKTTVAGVFAAGDNTTGFRAVSIATAAGTKAGAVINHQLIQERSLHLGK